MFVSEKFALAVALAILFVRKKKQTALSRIL